MNSLQKRLWIAKSKLLFLLTPKENRIRLEIAVDGRQLTYLLVSLQSLGYAVHVVESPSLYGQLLSLKNSTRLPFIFGGVERACSLVISDRHDVVERAKMQGVRAILLDSDFFTQGRTEPRMPYFMHPSIYQSGLHAESFVNRSNSTERKVRIGFFGTKNRDAYTKNFQFPIINREEILNFFIENYRDIISEANLPISTWKHSQMKFSIVESADDQIDKFRFSQRDYLKALSECDFVISPPGCCMPLCHNVIEAMWSGSIPILNYNHYFDPSLSHGFNCLTFTDKAGLKRVVEEALAMDQEKIRSMRRAVWDYYDEYLTPAKWLGKFLSKHSQGATTLLVNAEEVSTALMA